jgi:hypothetical protein
LPGARSATWRFDVRVDTEPPYLRIEHPRQGEIRREARVGVRGQSEPGAAVEVNGAAVDVDGEGGFRFEHTPHVGDNELHVVARDPAGNVTELLRVFTHQPDADAVVRFDDALPRLASDHFLTASTVAALSGFTQENAQIVVLTQAGDRRSSAYTDERGRFTLNIAMFRDTETFVLKVVAPSGFESRQTVAVSIDDDVPAIGLAAPLPRFTSETLLTIEGVLEAGAGLTLNGERVPLQQGGSYGFVVALVDGANPFEFVATDAVGNVEVEQYVVRVDRHAPRLGDHTVAATRTGDSGLVNVRVLAEDESGLAVVAPFVVQAGERRFTGYLRYNRAISGYHGAVEMPHELAAEARLLSVELADHAGNRQVFEF